MNQFKDTDFRGISLSATDKGYDHKPIQGTADYWEMSFSTYCNANLEFMVQYIKEGRSLAGIYTQNKMKSSERTTDKFVGTQFFFIDIDFDIKHKTLGSLIHEFDKHQDIFPTLAYTTTNHMMYLLAEEKDGETVTTPICRYRLVYVTREVIKGVENCCAFAEYLADRVKKFIGVEVDPCSKHKNQMMHGNGVPAGRTTQYYAYMDPEENKLRLGDDKKGGVKWIKENIFKDKDESGWLEMFDGCFGTTSVSNLPTVEVMPFDVYYDVSEADLEQWRKDYPCVNRKSTRTQGNGQGKDFTGMFSPELQRELSETAVDGDVLRHFQMLGWKPCLAPVQDSGSTFTRTQDGFDSRIKSKMVKGGKYVMYSDGDKRRVKVLPTIATKARYNSPTHCADDVLLTLIWCSINIIDNSDGAITRTALLEKTYWAMSIEMDDMITYMKEHFKSKEVYINNSVEGDRRVEYKRLQKSNSNDYVSAAAEELLSEGKKVTVNSVHNRLQEYSMNGVTFTTFYGKPCGVPARPTVHKSLVRLGYIEESKKREEELMNSITPDMSAKTVMNILGCKKTKAYEILNQLRSK